MLRIVHRIVQTSRILAQNEVHVSVLKNVNRECSFCEGGYVTPVKEKSLMNINSLGSTKRNLKKFVVSSRSFSSKDEIDSAKFENLSAETLESLMDHFEEVIDQAQHLTDADVSYGDGVLTVKFGSKYGTYVINRQLPNRQIWLSSPKSGPKRYDYINGKWIYKHDGISLHELLMSEIPDIVQSSVSFDKCMFSGFDTTTKKNKM